MSLVKCPYCGKQVSSTANKCVHCGKEFFICSECGLVNKGENVACKECGNPKSENNLNAKSSKNAKNNEKVDFNEKWLNKNSFNKFLTYENINKKSWLKIIIMWVLIDFIELIGILSIRKAGLENPSTILEIESYIKRIKIYNGVTAVVFMLYLFYFCIFGRIGNIARSRFAIKSNYGVKNFIIKTKNDLFGIYLGKLGSRALTKRSERKNLLSEKRADIKCGFYIYTTKKYRVLYILCILVDFLGILAFCLYCSDTFTLLLTSNYNELNIKKDFMITMGYIAFVIIMGVVSFVLNRIYNNGSMSMLKDYVGDDADKTLKIINTGGWVLWQ